MRWVLSSLALLVSCGFSSPPPPLSLDLGHDLGQDRGRADRRADLLPPVQSLFVAIGPGTFRMGSPLGEPCRQVGETEHQVTLTRRFELLSTEVTQASFGALMGYVPFSSCGERCPVTDVTWNEAAAYANALSKAKKLALCYACSGSGAELRCAVDPAFENAPNTIYDCRGYRLPTEAEWELAYRAGSLSAFYAGAKSASCSGPDPVADGIGWYKENGGGALHPVGQKKANPLGLYDLAGNAAEWTNDRFQEDLGTLPVADPVGPAQGVQRVLRGGSFDSEALALRAAARTSEGPLTAYSDYGFRVARTLPP